MPENDDADAEFARDAFISYANQDAAVAQALCESLERRGIKCWIAPRDVPPGTLYAESIVRAINGAKVLVLILSQHSVASAHVGKEVERASSKRRPILALRTDAAPLTPALEYFLSESQWVDATAVGTEAALLKVGDSVARVKEPPAWKPMNAGAATRPAEHSAGRRRIWLLATCVLAALAIAYLLADKFWLAKHAAAVDAAATASSTEASRSGDKSVAVLPFEDLSENKDQAYFSDGLSGELIVLLAKTPGLRVPARTSSFYFKGKQATLQEIAKALNVTHVVEGTVRKSGQTLRITTDLVRVEDGTPMWSETYDRKLDDVFKIQDDIAGSVVSALKVSLFGGASPRATPTANPAAYTAFLECQEAGRRESRDSIAQAIAYCQQAVDLDPNFAPGWAILGELIQVQFVGFSVTTYEVARPKVFAAVQRALALDPALPEAHYAMASLLYQMDFDPGAADAELKRAISLDPTDSNANWLDGYVADVQCRFDYALAALERSRARDPLFTDVHIQMGNVNYRRGRLAEAAAAYHTALALDEHAGSVHYRLGLVALLQGDPTAALAEFEQEPDPDFHSVGLPLAYDALGRKADAGSALAHAESTAAMGAAYQIALIYAARKDADDAFRWLDRAYRQRDAGMLWIKGEPLLKDLRPDPRFQKLLHQMHLD
jgi:TolB-like protein/tetratricopeptide (TPR) repeat protein